MLMAVDIGNSQISCGLFVAVRLMIQFSIKTHGGNYYEQLSTALKDRSGVDFVIISSVVPDVDEDFAQAITRVTHKNPAFIQRHVAIPFGMDVENHNEVGADLLVNAYGAWHSFLQPLIIVDLGTATTFQVIDEGRFLGAAIAPGFEISAQALFAAAAKLNPQSINKTKKAIGQNTVQALDSGLFLGHGAMIDGMVAKMKKELGKAALTIATGGLANTFAGTCVSFDKVDSELTLKGLRLIYEQVVLGGAIKIKE